MGNSKTLSCTSCRDEIDNTFYEIEGNPVCSRCFVYSKSDEAVVDFVQAYPGSFIDYLKECMVSTPELIVEMLRDYREWNNREYIKWVLS